MNNNFINNNFILRSDSYKYSHNRQYPPNTDHVYSYFESRGGQFSETVFFGLQYYLKKYFEGVQVTHEQVDAAKKLIDAHMGPGHFNEEGWRYIVNTYGGKLPLIIKAVPEGTVVPTGNVLMTVENTDGKVPWLTNFAETLLTKVWFPTTVATQSRAIKQIITAYLEQTGDPSLIDFKLHDFGYRGVSSEESAAIGGAAHLINFKGSDTIAAIPFLAEYYNQLDMPAFSIPASEHSTITSWGGPEHELDAFDNMLTQYPEGMVACVSDSYDIRNACEMLWGHALRNKVLNRKGTLVVRPDSGDPVTVVLTCLAILASKFGSNKNEKGFSVLNPQVRIIQGDGVNLHSITAILDEMKKRGWSADNIAFGMGGALLQQLNRDTCKFAFKCSHIDGAGFDRPVYKNPVTDTGKRSKAGKLALVKDSNDKFITVSYKGNSYDGFPENNLVTVFEDGEVKQLWAFDKIKQRANE